MVVLPPWLRSLRMADRHRLSQSNSAATSSSSSRTINSNSRSNPTTSLVPRWATTNSKDRIPPAKDLIHLRDNTDLRRDNIRAATSKDTSLAISLSSDRITSLAS